ncbi:MAG TPA: type II toxin-antitoxin system ParD family antitoxin [Candidatus Acidoferrales bacterium]|jgi:antitoxin ParD1/3/4|nr:type II toxin-antitoxin system ParD family antitoxin [Candidatus Acidoferrales bacterium]
MNLHLTPELEELVQSKVKSGRYNSVSEVVREALGLMEERDQIPVARKHQFQNKIADGLQSLRLGKGVDGEAVFDRIEAEIETLERNGRK